MFMLMISDLNNKNNTPNLCVTCWAFVKPNQKDKHIKAQHQLLSPKAYRDRERFVETANSYQKSWFVQRPNPSSNYQSDVKDIWYQKISIYFLPEFKKYLLNMDRVSNIGPSSSGSLKSDCGIGSSAMISSMAPGAGGSANGGYQQTQNVNLSGAYHPQIQ